MGNNKGTQKYAGAKRVISMIPYGRQYIDENDVEAVKSVLQSDFLTQGTKVKEFEKKLANYCKAKYAIVFSSGTAALHGAYFAAGLTKSDEVITTPVTFLATANAAFFLGAKPVFVDVQQDTGNINFNLIEEKITKQTKVIAPVDYSGQPADLAEIYKIARKNDLLVVEDACHALGAEYKGSKIGSCKYSDMSVFSFHPVKSITTGEGGAVLTNNRDYYETLLMFRQHGVMKDVAKFKHSSEFTGDWYYEMHCLGYNYRLTDIQCALGISQLKKLDKFIQRRIEIVKIYKEAFKNNDFFDLPIEKKDIKSSWHLYPIKLKDEYKDKKKLIFSSLRKKGLWVQVHYIPVYWQPYYQELGYRKGICPNAEDFYQREISLPLYYSMTDEDVGYVEEKLFEVFKGIDKCI